MLTHSAPNPRAKRIRNASASSAANFPASVSNWTEALIARDVQVVASAQAMLPTQRLQKARRRRNSRTKSPRTSSACYGPINDLRTGPTEQELVTDKAAEPDRNQSSSITG
jgi:hypothetical protein